MKILHLTSHLNTGGITSYLLQLTKGQMALGHHPMIAYSRGDMAIQFQKNHVPLIKIPLKTKNILSPKLLYSWFKLKSEYDKTPWDIIHAHTRVSQCLARMLSYTLKIPYITTFHGHYRYHFGRKIWPFLGDQTISISSSVENELKDLYPQKYHQITTITHGIDIDHFHPNAISQVDKDAFRKKIGLRPHPTLGIIGRLAKEKGHLKLLQTLKILIEDKNMLAQLLIVGDGRLRQDLLTEIEQLGLKSNVILIPTQPDPRLALSVIDIYVTHHDGPEGFGLALLEAIAMGKPIVISSKRGGLKDYLRDGKHGFLLDNASPNELAKKIAILLKSPELKAKMSEENIKIVRNEFSHKRMTEETMRVYENVL